MKTTNNNQITSKKRILYLDLIRIFACLLVVLVHVSGESFAYKTIGSPYWQVSNFYNCLGILGVPLFFMISGALLLDSKKISSTRQFFLHHALPIVGYYFFTITLYDLMAFLLDEPVKDWYHFKENVLLKIACGSGVGVGHIWFLSIIFSIYLITPLVKPAFEKKENCIYFLLLFFGIAVLAHSILYLPLPYHIVWQSLYGLTPYYLILSYLGYYCLGHYLAEFVFPVCVQWDRKYFKLSVFISALLLFMGITLTTVTNALSCMKQGEASTYTNEPYFVGQFFASASIFYLIGLFFYQKETKSKWIPILADVTFGVYLIHPLVIDLLHHFNVQVIYSLPVISIPLVVLVVTLLSGFLTVIWKKCCAFLRRRTKSALHSFAPERNA